MGWFEADEMNMWGAIRGARWGCKSFVLKNARKLNRRNFFVPLGKSRLFCWNIFVFNEMK